MELELHQSPEQAKVVLFTVRGCAVFVAAGPSKHGACFWPGGASHPFFAPQAVRWLIHIYRTSYLTTCESIDYKDGHQADRQKYNSGRHPEGGYRQKEWN